MKTSYAFRLPLLRIFVLLGFIFSSVVLSAPPENVAGRHTTAAGNQDKKFTISGPYTHQNLSIFLIHGKDQIRADKLMTLQEAMDQKKVIVYETGDVNELKVENVASEDEIYIQSGDIVKGGKQDRIFQYDMILPPRSGKQAIAAFCVEHGRWSRRGPESVATFNSSAEQVATKDLKLAAKYIGVQTEVWDKVAQAQDMLSRGLSAPIRSGTSESSLQLTLENETLHQAAQNYVDKLSRIIEGQNDVVGYSFAINGKINSTDIYASRKLFKKLWPKLLKASAVEAIANMQVDTKFKPPTTKEVTGAMAEAERGRASEKRITSRLEMVTRESERNILFETRDQKQRGHWIHKNYVTKDTR